LQNRGALLDDAGSEDVCDLEPDEITPSQLAVDRHIEQSQIAHSTCQFESNADCPHVLWKQRSLLTDNATVVPSLPGRDNHRQI
jgi:hypothetical protein